MISAVGLASGLGGNLSGSKEGPLFLRDHLSFPLDWRSLICQDSDEQNNLKQITLLNTKLAKECFSLAEKREFFISIGGDHSCAIGTWSGVAESYRSDGDLGLIWIDAHMDAHTPETSKSGNIHGMPLATLLGYGSPSLSQILSPNPKIKPQNLVIIGARSYEKEEKELLQKLNVRIYFMEEIFSRGIQAVLEEAITHISKTTIGYGISFDLDSIDPSFVQAVGTPVPEGLDLTELLESLKGLFLHKLPVAFELVEYNPSLDQDLKTFEVIKQILSVIEPTPALL